MPTNQRRKTPAKPQGKVRNTSRSKVRNTSDPKARTTPQDMIRKASSTPRSNPKAGNFRPTANNSHLGSQHSPEPLPQRIAEGQAILDGARSRLKEEFVGIDPIIDELITYVRPWFLFPELQERPVVINLWGMTGVGKTSVVARLVELLSCQGRFFRFDLGDKDSFCSFYESVSELSRQDDETPLIVALDEFQHTRTVDEAGMERESDRNRMVWDLMDSGKLRSYGWDRGVDELSELATRLEELLAKGVVVRNGRIVSGAEHAWRDLHLDRSICRGSSKGGRGASHGRRRVTAPNDPEGEEGETAPRFISERHFDRIIDAAGGKLGITLKVDLDARLGTMDGPETVAFLKRVVQIGKVPKEKRFSKLLVIVMGNLDEAFQMAQDFNADIDPDFFAHHTLKIGLVQIKEALKRRFRLEQIGRLGNLHIIYPGITRASFERVIANELHKISANVSAKLGLDVEFDPSINDLIFREGVFPTQGFRPIFSTIHQLISGNLGLFLGFPEVWSRGVDRLRISESERRLQCSFQAGGKELFSAWQTIPTPLSDRRAPRMDDKQAIIAVHESGHAVTAIALLSILPESIASVTSGADDNGFIVRGRMALIPSREEILRDVAVRLSGFVAERMVFGADRMTVGSEEDISNATRLLCRLVKAAGMGSTVAAFSLPEVGNDHTLHSPEIEVEVRALLASTLALAEETLQRERRLLLELSDHLSDHARMTGEEFKKFIETHASPDLLARVEARRKGTGHRTQLKALVADMVGNLNPDRPIEISLVEAVPTQPMASGE